MDRLASRVLVLSSMVLAAAIAAEAADPAAKVTVLATPDGGIQPQALADSEGGIDLVYFKGDPNGGDLFYVHAGPGRSEFSRPVRVNSQPGSAIAIGTIRGAQVARGRDGRLHVAWNGSRQARPANPIAGVPMLYARSNPDRTAFEPQRNLMLATSQLDGGGSVAADGRGNVYVGWHARAEGAPEGEKGRRFYVTRSSDDGATFAPEEPALRGEVETGACACCATRALADSRGTLRFLYRAATENVNRDMTLLTSRDGGRSFERTVLQPWRLFACPMSSESLAEGGSGVWAAWETDGQVYFRQIDGTSPGNAKPIAPPGGGDRKHPALAVNADGETLLAWAEGTAWQRGGALAWRLFDSSGKATRESGRIDKGVPTWSLPAAVALPEGRFVIIH